MAICKNCENEFEGKRADAKFCSDVCRVIFNRNIKVGPVTDNVTDKPHPDDVVIPDAEFTKLLEPLKDMIQIVPERTPGGHIRVSKPGDADYVPQCETTRAFVEGRHKLNLMADVISQQVQG